MSVCRQWCSVPWCQCCGDFWFAQTVVHLGSFCGGCRAGGGGVSADGRPDGPGQQPQRPRGQAGWAGQRSGPGGQRGGAVPRRQGVGTAACFWTGGAGGSGGSRADAGARRWRALADRRRTDWDGSGPGLQSVPAASPARQAGRRLGGLRRSRRGPPSAHCRRSSGSSGGSGSGGGSADGPA